MVFFLFVMFAFIGCNKPDKVDIGELVEALQSLDHDVAVDADVSADEINTDDDALLCEEGEKRCESQWVMVCTGGEFVQSEHCIDCGPLCQCVESAGDAWCEHTDPGPDDADLSDEDQSESDVSDNDVVEVEVDLSAEAEAEVDEDVVLVEDDLLTENEVEDDAVVVGDDVVTDDDVVVLTWTDPNTNLMWQDPIVEKSLMWGAAVTYCNTTLNTEVYAGYTGWRLPTISELRTIVDGCPSLETGGACGVTDSCKAESTCYSIPNCQACNTGGCYFLAGLDEYICNNGTADVWSATENSENTNEVYLIDFGYGLMSIAIKPTNYAAVKCVRDAP